MPTHLITGGSGFLGNLIARRLLEAGEVVRVLDIWQDDSQPKEIEFINCDIRDKEKLARAMKGCEYVHHNVALVPLTKSGKDFWEINVIGSQIASQVAKQTGVQNFIHMSSSAIFGRPSELPISLITPPSPIEIYGRGKLAGENKVKESLHGTDINLTIIRPRTILGPGRLGIFQVLFQWISENKNVYTIGNGNNLFQFIHAHDLMDAYMLAVGSNQSLELNVGTQSYSTLKDTLQNLIDYSGSTSKVIGLPAKASIGALRMADYLKVSPLAPWHYLTYDKPFYFDTKPLESLGWTSKYSNDQMFIETYNSFLSNYQLKTESHSPHRKSISGGVLNLLKKFS
jgi:nucleoside-diphosphate-sugar epimerase